MSPASGPPDALAASHHGPAPATYSVGALVRARGREWVVLPGSDAELLLLRPLGGADEEVAGVLSALEDVVPATFGLPDPARPGDDRSARLLRDALRLGFRSSAGPFRSFGALAFEPRPYQLVPLLMALRLDPVRLLVADDVGTGKTAATLMVAAELLAQGDATRLAVLCPPHLAVQWQAEMADKFHLEAELVLASTASRLERGCRVGQSLFERHPLTVVSTEFIKADRRRAEFLHAAPELVVVDEAHTCAGNGLGRAHHQRHELVAGLAGDPARHLLLVTATPHSGKEEAFRSLLALLDPSFAHLAEDLSGEAHVADRRRLARHFVQRRRADLAAFLDDTPFPRRLEREEAWSLGPEYRRLLQAALAYAAQSVTDGSGGHHRQRVRWWSALAMLRSIASSPAAAAETLRHRAGVADTDSVEEADLLGRAQVLDQADEDAAPALDMAPGAGTAAGRDQPGLDDQAGSGGPDDQARSRRRLGELARMADACRGEADTKLAGLVQILDGLIAQGCSPIVFCRYIPTAGYLVAELRARLGGVEVAGVSGAVPASQRPSVVDQLSIHSPRVLVATDCLSEGINLQEHFDAVVHYDLSWNPTRHEQREGRVDRFGQPADEVKVVTYYGGDNRIDQLVLEVLLRKHRRIRDSLGISVPVPGDPNQVVEALVSGLLATGAALDASQLAFEGMGPAQTRVLSDWEDAAARERRSRTMFAQETIKTAAVAEELAAVRAAIGAGADVATFVADAVVALGGSARGAAREAGRPEGADPARLSLAEAPRGLRHALGPALGPDGVLRARFTGTPRHGEVLLSRGHPFVAALAGYVLDAALDGLGEAPARRSGVMRTDAVDRLTTLVLVRFRFDLHRPARGADHQLLAEDAGVVAFVGDPATPTWLPGDQAEALLGARPSANVSGAQASAFLSPVIEAFPRWRPALDEEARRLARVLADSHGRVRTDARGPAGSRAGQRGPAGSRAGQRGPAVRVEPQLPPDVLGTYVLLPGPPRPAPPVTGALP